MRNWALRGSAVAVAYLLFTGVIYACEQVGMTRGVRGLGIVGLAVDVVALLIIIVALHRRHHRMAGTLGPLFALLLVVLFFATTDAWFQNLEGGFWTLRNLRTVAVQTSTIAVAALGMTVIIIAGGIDLSSGTALAFCATMLAYVLDSGNSVNLAIAMCLVVGCLTGLVNGTLISTLRVVPFIVTLGTMTAFLGLAKIVAKETTVRPPLDAIPAWLPRLVTPVPEPAWLAYPLLPNLAWGVWLAIAMAVGLAAVLHLTVFGRHVFAVGSSEPTARLCGVHVARTKIAVYTLAGFFVGMAGMYQFARLSSGSPTSGMGMELRIIAAVVIGGGSLNGGRGSVIGTLTGAAIMQVISSGCTALELRNPIQDIIIGIIIVVAVSLDQLRQRTT